MSARTPTIIAKNLNMNCKELNTVTNGSIQFRSSVNTALREIYFEVAKTHTKSDMYESFIEKFFTVFSFAYPTKYLFLRRRTNRNYC